MRVQFTTVAAPLGSTDRFDFDKGYGSDNSVENVLVQGGQFLNRVTTNGLDLKLPYSKAHFAITIITI